MSRDKRYQALLNSKRWAETKRAVWLRANGLCEECAKQGLQSKGLSKVFSNTTVQKYQFFFGAQLSL